jgi:hypothetical protein
MLITARILVLVADNDGMALCHRGCNHWVALQQRSDHYGKIGVPFVALPNPQCSIGRKPEADVVGGRNLRDDSVDSADFNARSSTFGAICEHGTSSMSMCQDQELAGPARRCDLPCELRALGGLATTRRCFHRNDRSIRSERSADTIVAHGAMSVIS